jgi:hypothetical protein
MATTTEIPEPIPQRSDERKFIRNWAYLRMAHEALMLKRVQGNAKKADALAKFAATGNASDLVPAESEDEDEEMNIGNETHYHYQGAPPAEPAPAPATPSATTTTKKPPATSSGLGTLGNLALGAALATGLGGAGYAIYDATRPESVYTDTDSDTSIDVVFPK